jgi:hypothetical protein
MNDSALYSLSASLLLLMAGSSVYEYKKCKRMLKENPALSYEELIESHINGSQVISLFGAAGAQIAMHIYGYSKPKLKEISSQYASKPSRSAK